MAYRDDIEAENIKLKVKLEEAHTEIEELHKKHSSVTPEQVIKELTPILQMEEEETEEEEEIDDEVVDELLDSDITVGALIIVTFGLFFLQNILDLF